MSQTVLYIAMSLDGFIADIEGGVTWLKGDGSEPEHPGTYSAFFDSVDTIVMGRKTYEQVIHELSPDAWPYVGKECYVLSYDPHPDTANVMFRSDLKKLLDLWRNEQNRRVWICGGASIAQRCLRDSAIDRLRIAIIPVLLGSGIALFGQGLPRQNWKLADTAVYNGIVELTYDRSDG